LTTGWAQAASKAIKPITSAACLQGMLGIGPCYAPKAATVLNMRLRERPALRPTLP
jgi:hypothetical protein